MLRTFPSLRTLILTSECAPPLNFHNLQAVRYARKPLWMGTAKSKLYRVPVKPVIPDYEAEELKRLFNNYRTQIKSIRRFLTYKYSVDLLAEADTEAIEHAFREDLARCNEINNQWNEEAKILREERVSMELAVDIEAAKSRIAQELEKKERQFERIEEIVRKEKEAAPTFITPEKLDEAIEFAIANPVDYNFAIDLDGNRIEGRETKSVTVKQ